MADLNEAPFFFFVDVGEAAISRNSSTPDLAHRVATDAARGDLAATPESVQAAADALAAFAEPDRVLGIDEAGRMAHLAYRALGAVAQAVGGELRVQIVIPLPSTEGV